MMQAGGWKEVPSHNVSADALQAAARTMLTVADDLKIGRVRLRFFQHDPAIEWNPGDPDVAFAILNVPPFDPEMRGLAIHPSIREYGCAVVWVHADLSVGGMALVVAHECRHLWQDLNWRDGEGHDGRRDMDANIYALRDTLLPQDLAKAAQRYWTGLQQDTKEG